MDRYFEKAEAIFNNKELPDPSKPAMSKIVNGCKTSSEIIERKSSFYSFLKSKHILEYSDMEDFYDIEENKQYVLNTQEAFALIQDRFNVTNDYVNDCHD